MLERNYEIENATERLAADTRTWNYINSVFYLLVSDGAFLIEKHKYLWKIAKTKGPKAPKEAHLKDPWAERARNAVAAFQKKSKANATIPKGPGAPSPKKTTAAQNEEKNQKKLVIPKSTPPSYFQFVKGKCGRCGSEKHSTADCDIPKEADDRSDEQKATVKEWNKKVNKARKERTKAIKKLKKEQGVQ